MTSSILVTGGTGTLRRLVVRGLQDAGSDVRVLTRRSHEAEDVIRFMVGDLATGEGIEPAVDGVAVIETAQLRLEAVTASRRRTPGVPTEGGPTRQGGDALGAPEDAGAVRAGERRGELRFERLGERGANTVGSEPGVGTTKAPRGR